MKLRQKMQRNELKKKKMSKGGKKMVVINVAKSVYMKNLGDLLVLLKTNGLLEEGLKTKVLKELEDC